MSIQVKDMEYLGETDKADKETLAMQYVGWDQMDLCFVYLAVSKQSKLIQQEVIQSDSKRYGRRYIRNIFFYSGPHLFETL